MNIQPTSKVAEGRTEKERQLHQRGVTLWFTGLSGAGKSTIATALERRLTNKGYLCRVVDGDNLRAGINADLSFSAVDRKENIRRTAEICRLFTHTGIVTIASLITPTNALRAIARSIIGSKDMVEIFISTPLKECERRDVKGLYAAARRGEIASFTGITAPFEPPHSPDIEIDTTKHSIDRAVDMIMQTIKPRIVYEQ